MIDDTEKKTTGIHDEAVEKEGDAEKDDMSVKEVKGVSAKNCKTLLKKVQQNKSMDQEMHTIDVSDDFELNMSNILCIYNRLFSLYSKCVIYIIYILYYTTNLSSIIKT